MLLDEVHWDGRVPSRQLHSCSRNAVVTPAKAVRGVLALASCGLKAQPGRSTEQSARSGVVWLQLSVWLPKETMQEGREAEKVPLKNSSDGRRAARVRPIDYMLISVSFVPLEEHCVDKEILCTGLRRTVVEPSLVQPLGNEACLGLTKLHQNSRLLEDSRTSLVRQISWKKVFCSWYGV